MIKNLTKLSITSLFILSLSFLFNKLSLPTHATSPSIFLEPDTQTISVGDNLDIDIKADSQGEKIGIVQAYITYPYDPSNQDLVPRDTSLITSATSPFVFETKSITTNSDNVTIVLIARIKTAEYPDGITLDSTQTIATIPLQGVNQVSNKTLTIDKSKSHLSRKSDNEDLLDTVTGGSYTVSNQSSGYSKNELSPNITHQLPAQSKSNTTTNQKINKPNNQSQTNAHTKISPSSSSKPSSSPPSQTENIFQKIISFFSNILKTFGL